MKNLLREKSQNGVSETSDHPLLFLRNLIHPGQFHCKILSKPSPLWSSGAPSEKGGHCVAEKCFKASFGLCQKYRVNVPQPIKGDGSRKFNERRSASDPDDS
jgi:hypothetical protein